MIPIFDNPHDKLTAEEISSFARYYTIENAVSHEVCDELISLGQQLVQPAAKKHTYQDIMKLEHCFLPKDHYIHDIINPLWKLAIEKFKFDIKFVEPYKVQTYADGGYFGRHIDNYHGLNLDIDRKLSLTLQLSDSSEYDGGGFVCGQHKITRSKGSVTFFPSFYPHLVEKVTQGRRWCLIGWAWGPYWR
jgi:hypothetical protein